MKEEILRILWENKGTYVSGEQISQSLAVTRTAIWKHIKSLKEEGYSIESSTRSGYCLVGQPDLLLPEELKRETATRWLGQVIHYHRTIDSTNSLAKKLAVAGALEGTIIIAEEQTAGKGRLGRQWTSPFGLGLWLSVILRPQITPLEAPKITMLVSVALQEAILEATGLPAKIKWPNDIFLGDKKVAGILLEMSGEMDSINHLIVGMGVNVNLAQEDFPQELKDKATSLKIELGREICRVALTKLVLAKLEYYYELFKVGEISLLMEKWRSASWTLGKAVRVTTPTEVLEGQAVDFGQDGSLLIRLANGSLREIMAGDVTLRRE